MEECEAKEKTFDCFLEDHYEMQTCKVNGAWVRFVVKIMRSSGTLGHHSLSTPNKFIRRRHTRQHTKTLAVLLEMEILCPKYLDFFDGDSEGTLWENLYWV